MSNATYLTAGEAARQLGVSVPTLYSYVSRGLVRSVPADSGSRARRYMAEDVRRLQRRKEVRRHPDAVAQQALQFGDPLLESAITLIENDTLYYRGHDVAALIESRTFEEVAALLWTDAFDSAETLFSLKTTPLKTPSPTLPLIERWQSTLTHANHHDLAAYQLTPAAVAQTGVKLLRLVTESAENTPIAQQLATRWNIDPAINLLNTALILCADHELNISAFTARCVASAGATPYMAVIAALSALSGYKHGGQSAHVQALFREAAQDLTGALRNTLRRDGKLPGFGHTLYPQGDPRATLLLAQLAHYQAENAGATLTAAIHQHATETLGIQPNIDFALVGLQYALDLPADAPLTLFGIGRTAGWIAHCIEQYNADRLIRPRARYVGTLPDSTTESPPI